MMADIICTHGISKFLCGACIPNVPGVVVDDGNEALRASWEAVAVTVKCPWLGEILLSRIEELQGEVARLKAALADAYEDAAKVADRRSQDANTVGESFDAEMLQRVATAIRARGREVAGE